LVGLFQLSAIETLLITRLGKSINSLKNFRELLVTALGKGYISYAETEVVSYAMTLIGTE
jgi:hypothetical protein